MITGKVWRRDVAVKVKGLWLVQDSTSKARLLSSGVYLSWSSLGLSAQLANRDKELIRLSVQLLEMIVSVSRKYVVHDQHNRLKCRVLVRTYQC